MAKDNMKASPEPTMLVNASHPLPHEWEPDEIVVIRADGIPPPERWHLRYVGREAALEMHERGWVLEEWHEAHKQVPQ